ncbi:MAG: LPS export ABC transporter periplasmic protein LptC [Rikenellaceae bacterium]
MTTYFKWTRAYRLYTPLFIFVVMGCSEVEVKSAIEDPETTPTMMSTKRTVVHSGNGNKYFRVYADSILMFELAERPYALYPLGLKVETFGESDTEVIESDLRADSARYYTKEKRWEAFGNVVGNNYAGDKSFRTERIYWLEDEARIYSDTTTVVREGRSITRGDNFETDQNFETWTFNRASGLLAVDQVADSTSSASGDSTVVRLNPDGTVVEDGLPVDDDLAVGDKLPVKPEETEPVIAPNI